MIRKNRNFARVKLQGIGRFVENTVPNTPNKMMSVIFFFKKVKLNADHYPQDYLILSF